MAELETAALEAARTQAILLVELQAIMLENMRPDGISGELAFQRVIRLMTGEQHLATVKAMIDLGKLLEAEGQD